MNPVRLSKLLSLVLRHEPGRLGLTLDDGGWVSVPALIEALVEHGHDVSRDELTAVVRSNDKQRFALDVERDLIRANQGHSVPVDLGLVSVAPPDRLYHGTPNRNLTSILTAGLRRQGRHAVHLSPDLVTAHRVGARRGAHTVLAVNSAAMHADGFTFSVSANGVWLVDEVPPRYLSEVKPAD